VTMEVLLRLLGVVTRFLKRSKEARALLLSIERSSSDNSLKAV